MNNERKAIYAGSFDPFTNGHLYIAKEASLLCDEVYVCVARNPNKKRITNEYDMVDAIRTTLKENGINNTYVLVVDGLIADFCMKNNIEYLVRGLRNTSDYMYEENIAKINAEVNPNLKTIYFRAKNEVISSSMVRELHSHGKDISKYIPKQILEIYN